MCFAVSLSIQMKTKKEKNINVFNKDVQENAGYIYTSNKILSAKIATAKQTGELTKYIKKFFPKDIGIVDIGCGDGKHTVELFKSISPGLIVGIDPAKEAIATAKKRVGNNHKDRIFFQAGNIYDVNKLFKTKQFDLAIIRGVLHHLYDPQEAIRQISRVFPAIIIIEANGYNPILKIIEKISPYHREHEEKSYWPPLLNKWFEKQGYKVISERYFGIVPYFFPDTLAKMLKYVEPFFENIPVLNRLYSACNIILYRKQ